MHDLDQFIGDLKQQGLTPVAAIKAVRLEFSLSLGSAKQAVMSHAAWASEAAAGDTFHEEIERIFRDELQ